MCTQGPVGLCEVHCGSLQWLNRINVRDKFTNQFVAIASYHRPCLN